MIIYKKENGFPVDMKIDTDKIKPTSENSHCKYHSKFIIDNKIVYEFSHINLRARSKWADGFFNGIKFKE